MQPRELLQSAEAMLPSVWSLPFHPEPRAPLGELGRPLPTHQPSPAGGVSLIGPKSLEPRGYKGQEAPVQAAPAPEVILMLFILPLRVNSGRGEAALPRLPRLLMRDPCYRSRKARDLMCSRDLSPASVMLEQRVRLSEVREFMCGAQGARATVLSHLPRPVMLLNHGCGAQGARTPVLTDLSRPDKLLNHECGQAGA